MTRTSNTIVEPEIVPGVLERETADDDGLTSELGNVEVGVKEAAGEDVPDTVTERTDHSERESKSDPREMEVRTEVATAAAKVHVQVRLPLSSDLWYD